MWSVIANSVPVCRMLSFTPSSGDRESGRRWRGFDHQPAFFARRFALAPTASPALPALLRAKWRSPEGARHLRRGRDPRPRGAR